MAHVAGAGQLGVPRFKTPQSAESQIVNVQRNSPNEWHQSLCCTYCPDLPLVNKAKALFTVRANPLTQEIKLNI